MAASFIALVVGVRPWRLVEPAAETVVDPPPETAPELQSAALLVGDDQGGHRNSVEALAGLR
jgi:hypothetical protein